MLYHFGSREALLVRVVQTVGERIAANIDVEVRSTGSPQPVAVLWAGITSEPQLLRAYFALVGGSAESAEVAIALRDLKDTYVRLIARRLHGEATGDAAPIVSLIALALLRGLLLEWIETGDGPVIDAGLAELAALTDS